MTIRPAIVVSLPATIPTVLIERGQPDREVASLGEQTYQEVPMKGEAVSLSDGGVYLVHGLRIHGQTPVLVQVRRLDA